MKKVFSKVFKTFHASFLFLCLSFWRHVSGRPSAGTPPAADALTRILRLSRNDAFAARRLALAWAAITDEATVCCGSARTHQLNEDESTTAYTTRYHHGSITTSQVPKSSADLNTSCSSPRAPEAGIPILHSHSPLCACLTQLTERSAENWETCPLSRTCVSWGH